MANDKEDLLVDWGAYMLRLKYADPRGTADTEIVDSNENNVTRAVRHTSMLLKQSQLDLLYNAFMRAQPEVPIRRAPYEHGGSPVLEMEVYPIREVRLKGRVFSMSSFRDSIIKATVVEEGELVERVGEIIDLWEHCQPISPRATVSNTFALVRWYKASPIFAPRSVRLWTEDLYVLSLISARRFI
ncbi:hypothetical protein BDV93DRAFT_552961 [Ceratobasidium sp. AG-I]|nr:hypothetical protein BDV93DRAFT_552961 [Ceratobasidium sp. AG-I]